MLRISFDPADADGDGRLTRAEVEKYFLAQQQTMQLPLALTFGTHTPSLFQLLDANGDGRLGVRELRTAFDRLKDLEPGDTPYVTRAAIQPSARVGLAKFANISGGVQPVAPVPLGMAPPVITLSTAGPRWFSKMDRNADGDVSRTEFLGPKEAFDELDADGDGLISLAEAEAYEKKVRPNAAAERTQTEPKIGRITPPAKQ